MATKVSEFLSSLTLQELSDLPSKPVEPLALDCCGNGCRVCVYDLYEQEVEDWISAAKAKFRQGNDFCHKSSCSVSTPLHIVHNKSISKRHYKKFVILDITHQSVDTFVYRFKLDDGVKLEILPGEHLVGRIIHAGKEITREYTPVTDIYERGFFDILIKIYPNGEFTNYVKNWKIGDEVEWRGPFGRFQYLPSKLDYIVMIAGGTGITPMMQIIQMILSNEEDETRIILIYSNKTVDDILLKERLDAFQDYWNFTMLFVFSRVMEEEEVRSTLRYRDRVHCGKITCELLEKELCPLKTNSCKFLVCGTRSFERDVCSMLQSLGFTVDTFVTF